MSELKLEKPKPFYLPGLERKSEIFNLDFRFLYPNIQRNINIFAGDICGDTRNFISYTGDTRNTVTNEISQEALDLAIEYINYQSVKDQLVL